VTTRAGASPFGGGPTRTSAWSSGSYQCTPAGTPAPSGTATYTSSGKRAPADPAARKSQVVCGLCVVRTTPADRWSNRERSARSSSIRATSAVPASTATAGAVVAGSPRGSGTRGSVPAYRLKNHEKRSRPLGSRSRTTRGSSTETDHTRSSSSREGSYQPHVKDVSRCNVCVAVSTTPESLLPPGGRQRPDRAKGRSPPQRSC
jgi:hypothetical protein